MRNTAVVRLVENRLAWYPPGASVEPQWLDDDSAADKLRATLAQRRVKVCFAVPGFDARVTTLAVAPEEKKHLSKSLAFMLEEQFAADVDKLHFAFCPLENDTFAVAITAQAKMAEWQLLLAAFPGIQQWVPELGTAAYPAPIVDERAALAAAKEKLYGLRQTREAHAEANAIQHKHGSRKSGLPPTEPKKRRARTEPDGQGQLF